jgi:ABC-type antimicrobial peptide transport system permease subunit
MASIRPTTQWSSACYFPIEQNPQLVSSRALLVRTSGPPTAVLELLRGEAQAATPELPYVSVHAFDDVFRSLVRPWRLGTIVFGLFSGLALVIAAFGLAVVSAYAVTRRTREIGIRSALGAAPRRLVGLVLVRSLAVVMLGLLVGSGVAWAGAPTLGTQLFDVSPRDMRVLGSSVLLLMLVGALAAWVPARRAARINPIIALRTE